MKMIIGAHWIDDSGRTERVQLASINRDLKTDPLGLSLTEGKALLAVSNFKGTPTPALGELPGHTAWKPKRSHSAVVLRGSEPDGQATPALSPEICIQFGVRPPARKTR